HALVTRQTPAGPHDVLAHALIDLGNAVPRQERYSDPIKHWRDAIAAFPKVDRVLEAPRTSLAAAMKLAETEDSAVYAEAEQLLRQAIEMARTCEDPAIETQGLRELARLMCAQKNAEGLKLYDEAIELASKND